MNLQKMKEMAFHAREKIGKRGTVALCAAVVIGTGLLLNMLLGGNGSNGGRELAIDPSSLRVENDGNESVGADATVYNYFEAMQLSRRQARDEAMEVLLAVAESTTAVEAMKTEAMDSISQIARDMESESNIETLILSKGFEKCVAVINGDTASIIVKTEGLLANEVAQISEIVYEQTGIPPTHLKIIEKDV